MIPQLREFFAAAALPEIMSLHARPLNASALTQIAEQSYAVADAMLSRYDTERVVEHNEAVNAIITALDSAMVVMKGERFIPNLPELVVQAIDLARTLLHVEVPNANR